MNATAIAAKLSIPLPEGVPDTEVVRAVWSALNDVSEATSADIVVTAKKSRSATDKALILLEKAGAAGRTRSNLSGGRTTAARWHLAAGATSIDAAEGHAATTSEPQSRAEKVRAESAAGVVGVSTRLRRGELRVMVMEYLAAQPGQGFTASAVGRALNRSAGAVFNACEKMLASGVIVQTSIRPRKFKAKRS
jgi:hypothetical protein